MKEFFPGVPPRDPRVGRGALSERIAVARPAAVARIPSALSGRIAVYDAPAAAPRTEEVESADAREFIETLSALVHSLGREAGGSLPYTVIRELVENFVHADFAEPVVSILDGGTTLRFADQGPGLPDKERAALPGFTTATREMKAVIRGVGSGLPIVREWLGLSGGSLLIEDNLKDGTVVTVTFRDRDTSLSDIDDTPCDAHPRSLFSPPVLSTRQKQVLSLVLELGEVGPTIVSRELQVALSTAYRDLACLESEGLIQSDETGKRVLTEQGSRYLDTLLAL